MTKHVDSVRLLSLSKLDLKDLEASLGYGLQTDIEPLTSDKAGEPATLVAVVVLSTAVLKAISMWVLKRRTEGTVVLEYERTAADGSRERRRAEITFTESAPASADVVEQVGKALAVDPAVIAEAKELVTP